MEPSEPMGEKFGPLGSQGGLLGGSDRIQRIKGRQVAKKGAKDCSDWGRTFRVALCRQGQEKEARWR